MVSDLQSSKNLQRGLCPPLNRAKRGKLHTDESFILSSPEQSIHCRIINLSRAWLMSSGQVRDMKIADPLQVFINLGQYVFTHHTHVIDIVEQLSLRSINAPNNLNSKRLVIEKTPAMIKRRIQRLKEQCN